MKREPKKWELQMESTQCSSPQITARLRAVFNPKEKQLQVLTGSSLIEATGTFRRPWETPLAS
jgi:uncharacterized protein YfaP (DUF2135 family)